MQIMRRLFVFICLLALAWGGVVRAQEQEKLDRIIYSSLYTSRVLDAGEEINLRIKFSATAGDRFIVNWGYGQTDTVQITKTDEMVECSHHYEEGDMINHTLGLRALDTSSHIIGFALEDSIYSDVAPYDCPALRDLSFSNTSITYLRPEIQSLQSIKCVNNPLLWELSLYECPSLKKVECSGNRSLKRLILSNNYGLEEVVCTYNDSLGSPELPTGSSLKTVDFSNNAQLEYLGLEQSALTMLKCTDNPLLESLGLYGCLSIDSFYFSNNVQLKELVIENTGLMALDLSVAPNLEKVYCDRNDSLTILKVNNPLLQVLYCDHNRLESLLIDNCTALKMLSCVSNQLTSLKLPSDVILDWFACDSNSLTLSNIADLVNGSLDVSVSPQLIPVLRQVGQTLDLHSEMSINNKATKWYVLDTTGNIITDYTNIDWDGYRNGRFFFDKTGWYRIVLYHDALSRHDGVLIPAEVYYDVTVVDSVARPVFSEPSGAVRRHTLISLSTTTPDTRIYYTTDGSEPDSTAELYTDPISIDEAVTIRAIAIQDTFASRVATASYTIDLTANESDGAAEQVRIYAENKTIHIPETIDEVEVFTMDGQCVYRGSATAIPVKRSGLYVVVAKGGRWKVAVR